MSKEKHHKQTQDTTSSYEERIYKGIRKASMGVHKIEKRKRHHENKAHICWKLQHEKGVESCYKNFLDLKTIVKTNYLKFKTWIAEAKSVSL